MFVLITYDVDTQTTEGRKRLRKVAKECVNHGHRVQNSVFECTLSEVQFITLKNNIQNIIDPELDNVRFYFLGKYWNHKIDYLGKQTALDMSSTIII